MARLTIQALAETEVARLKRMSDAGMVTTSDLEAAQDQVEVLKAELDGDDVRAAQARLAAAQRVLWRASQLSQAGVVPGSEVTAAQTAVRVREAELKAAQAAATNAAPKMQMNQTQRN